MVEQTDAVVVGGGIVGTATAFHLVENGVETLLVDADLGGRATDAGAGIVTPPTRSHRSGENWLAFAAEAVAHYETLVEELETRGIDDHSYRRADLLSVAVDEDEVPELEVQLERAERRAARSNAVGDDTVEALSPAAAGEAFPPLADVERALRFTNAARVDGGQFTAALRRAAREEGLSTLEGTVEEILVADGAVSGVVVGDGGETARRQQSTAAERERVDADRVVVAGGAWSDAFGDDLGLDLPVYPIRGQILHLDVTDTAAAADGAGEWPIVGGFRENYIVPWGDGRLVVGATREHEAGYDPRVTAAGVDHVSDAALRLAPGLADATFEELRVGLRPGSPDGLPMLGAVPNVAGAFVATGHGPVGLTLGPFSGKVVAELVCGVAPSVDVSALTPDRF